jgi:hypothetical protein
MDESLKPVVEEVFIGRCFLGLGGTIEISVLGVVDIGFNELSRVEPEPMFSEMIRETEAESVLPCRISQFARHISLRTHSHGIPTSEGAIIHREAVVKLNNRDNVFSSRFLKQINPSIRVPFLSLEQGNEILIAELRLGTIMLDMIMVYGRILDIHKVGIPLAVEGRN